MATIIDLTRVLAGPFATLILGDLNHRIIKVEDTRLGDTTRHHPPQQAGVSAYFVAVNRNKESIILDLKHPEGRKVLLDLVAHADAVIENFRPDVMASLGLSYEELSAVNPGISLISINGFGSYGPQRDLTSFDVIAQAMSGAMAVTTTDPGEPIKPAIPLADVSAGMYGAMAVLQALLERKKTGLGCHLEVSLGDAMLAMSSRVTEAMLATGMRDEAPGLFPNSVFRTADGTLALAAYGDSHWQALCDALGNPDWSTRAACASMASRQAHRDELKQALEISLAARTTADWLTRFEAGKVPACAISGISQVMKDAGLLARDMLVTIDHPVAGPMVAFGNPIKRDGAPYRDTTLAPPRHGQHGRALLTDFLGYATSEAERLEAARAVFPMAVEPSH